MADPLQPAARNDSLAKTAQAVAPSERQTLSQDAHAPTIDGSALRPEAGGQARDAPAPRQPGLRVPASARIGRYVVLRQLGEGGMGVVYAAYDEELDRKVAVKLLRDDGPASAERQLRILREAQAMARVSHPNVVSVYEVGQVGDQVFIAMEFVDGTTLTGWQDGRRSWGEILHVYRAAGEGLLAAHQAGLVHRDFKPDNVLVGHDGRPRVADFGLARSESGSEKKAAPAAPAGKAAEPQPGGSGQLFHSPLTMAGTILGTPAYMSPEQHLGEQADSRSDQFSFCAALYEALYKTLPFAGDSLEALAFNVLNGRLRPAPAGSQVPARIERALRRGLHVDPAQRFPSMKELLSELTVDPRHDPTGAPLARRLFTVVMAGSIVLSTLAINISRLRGTLTVHQLLISTMTIYLAAVIVAWFLRRSLLRNAFHRGLVRMLLIALAQMTGMRLVAEFHALTLSQLQSVDMISVAAIGAVTAVHYMKSAWLIVGIALAAVAANLLFPAYSTALMVASYPIIGVCFAVLWNRAANASTRLEKDKPSLARSTDADR
jgi:serine/threonine-protein kinase